MKSYLPIDFRAGFAAAAIFAAACAAHAQPSGTGEAARPGGKFTTFDVSGAMGTYPAGMNDSGTIAGEYTSAVNVFHGFVRASDGTITTFDVSGAATTRAGGINDAGTIVGSYTDNNGNSHGFVRTADGNITTFDVPNATATQPSGINKKGVITGNYTDSAGGVHGFILNLDGSFTVFDAQQDAYTQPWAINDAGEVSGSSEPQNASHGFVRSPGGKIKIFDADPKYQVQTQPAGLNDAGSVSGTFIAKSGHFTGFLRLRDGSVTTFDPKVCPFWTLPSGINRAGEIAGTCVKSQTGGQYGFLRSTAGKMDVFRVGGMDTQAGGVNTAGVVFGIAFTHVENAHGFIGTP
jgi:hypothetical protein